MLYSLFLLGHSVPPTHLSKYPVLDLPDASWHRDCPTWEKMSASKFIFCVCLPGPGQVLSCDMTQQPEHLWLSPDGVRRLIEKFKTCIFYSDFLILCHSLLSWDMNFKLFTFVLICKLSLFCPWFQQTDNRIYPREERIQRDHNCLQVFERLSCQWGFKLIPAIPKGWPILARKEEVVLQ